MKRSSLKKIGPKGKKWQKARAQLVEIYREKGITRCERCGGTWALSFHHMEKRSSGRAEHTFEATRLLCAECHNICEYDKQENEKLEKKSRQT